MTRIPAFLTAVILLTGCSPKIMVDPNDTIHGRILRDFGKTELQIREQLSRYYPQLTDSQFRAWESDGRLEMMVFGGEKRYFNYAVNNLFRIDPSAGRIRDSLFPPKPDPLDSIRLANSAGILGLSAHGKPAVTLRITIEYALEVDGDAVPSGEVIHCWLPFPRESAPRQCNVRLIASDPPAMRASSQKSPHSTLYGTRFADGKKPALFSYRASFDISGHWFDPGRIREEAKKQHDRKPLQFTREDPPQVIFSPKVMSLADSLSANETNPLDIVRSFFHWIDRNIPWASAREYSTLDSIPDYVIDYRHGDCGMVTFLMMSMARYKNIPARWQSGWMLHPGEENLHDWCEIWYPGSGWVPLDMSFGLQKSDDPLQREFYLTGIDSYRMVVNDGFGGRLDPPKKYFRSEPYDFQRGEVEWSGGNLYFDKWDYHLNVISIEQIN